MSKKKGFVPHHKQGIILEAKLSEDFNPFYKREISAQDVKQVSELLEDLNSKGVPIRKAVKYSKKNRLFDY